MRIFHGSCPRKIPIGEGREPSPATWRDGGYRLRPGADAGPRPGAGGRLEKATTFDVIYLGVHADIDTVNGDQVAENAAALEGMTIGTATDPLYDRVQTLAPGSAGCTGGSNANACDQDQANETFSIDRGADPSYDMGMAFEATLTYVDGTTASITAIVFQDHDGNTCLAPQLSSNADQAAMEAQPIEAITLDSAVHADRVEDGWGLTAVRYDAVVATRPRSSALRVTTRWVSATPTRTATASTGPTATTTRSSPATRTPPRRRRTWSATGPSTSHPRPRTTSPRRATPGASWAGPTWPAAAARSISTGPATTGSSPTTRLTISMPPSSR